MRKHRLKTNHNLKRKVMGNIKMFSVPQIKGNIPDVKKIENFLSEQKLDPYERFQMERYGNILPKACDLPPEECFESGIEELERMAAWTEAQAESQISKDEHYQ